MELQFGEKVRDVVTGYEGTLTARFEYANGCVRYQVEALDKDGQLVETVFDEQRLEPMPLRKAKQRATSGGARSSKPPRRR